MQGRAFDAPAGPPSAARDRERRGRGARDALLPPRAPGDCGALPQRVERELVSAPRHQQAGEIRAQHVVFGMPSQQPAIQDLRFVEFLQLMQCQRQVPLGARVRGLARERLADGPGQRPLFGALQRSLWSEMLRLEIEEVEECDQSFNSRGTRRACSCAETGCRGREGQEPYTAVPTHPGRAIPRSAD